MIQQLQGSRTIILGAVGIFSFGLVASGHLLTLKTYLQANYRQMFGYRALRSAPNRDTPVLIHTYDYPTPRNAPAQFMGRPAVGPWVWRAMQGRPIRTDLAIG